MDSPSDRVAFIYCPFLALKIQDLHLFFYNYFDTLIEVGQNIVSTWVNLEVMRWGFEQVNCLMLLLHEFFGIVCVCVCVCVCVRVRAVESFHL